MEQMNRGRDLSILFDIMQSPITTAGERNESFRVISGVYRYIFSLSARISGILLLNYVTDDNILKYNVI